MIGNALRLDGLNEMVDFAYLPVSHINATSGAYECFITDDDGTVYDLDCEGTNWESCLVNELCWYGTCDAQTQGQLAHFLQCYEGPGANSEEELNPETRAPCLEEAGLNAQALMNQIAACTDNEDRLNRIKATLNASKAEMIATTNYTVFPVIYVDGIYQHDSTWTQLTRTLCGIAADHGITVPACAPSPIELSIMLDGELAPSDVGAMEAAVLSALNLAASNASLPVRFDTDDDALSDDGEVSYVNVNATIAVELTISGGRRGEAIFEAALLEAFVPATVSFINDDDNDPPLSFISYLNDALVDGLPKASAARAITSSGKS